MSVDGIRRKNTVPRLGISQRGRWKLLLIARVKTGAGAVQRERGGRGGVEGVDSGVDSVRVLVFLFLGGGGMVLAPVITTARRASPRAAAEEEEFPGSPKAILMGLRAFDWCLID